MACSTVGPEAPRQSAGLLGTSNSAQHSLRDRIAVTRHPPAPSRWAHRFMAPFSASALLGSLTRANTPPFFSTIAPQQDSLEPPVPHGTGSGGPPAIRRATALT